MMLFLVRGVSEYLLSSWWHCLGSLSSYDPAGGYLPLGMGLNFKKMGVFWRDHTMVKRLLFQTTGIISHHPHENFGTCCLNQFSAVWQNILTKSNLRSQDFFPLTAFRSQSLTEGHQGRKSSRNLEGNTGETSCTGSQSLLFKSHQGYTGLEGMKGKGEHLKFVPVRSQERTLVKLKPQ